MIYFQDWWSYGDNCIKETYTGILAGDKKFNDICIYEEKMFHIFLDSIAKEIITEDPKTHKQIAEENKSDVFLNGKIVNFNENILFVFSDAKIKELVYSHMFECYLITYEEEPAELNTYCAIIADKIYPLSDDYYFVNDIKKNDKNKIDNEEGTGEPKKAQDINNDDGNIDKSNDNNLNINQNIKHKKYNPKFETLNDKPKPKKSITLITAFNDDY